jgi:D-alanyl-D-alanine carboxypeptidase (penicillin-binding protein 5/6)
MKPKSWTVSFSRTHGRSRSGARDAALRLRMLSSSRRPQKAEAHQMKQDRSRFCPVLQGRPRSLACLAGAVLLCLGVAAGGQPAPGTAASRAILVEFATNAVLFEKNADQLTAPASLAKLMTVEVLFDQIRKGRVSLDDAFTVSEQAGRFARGSTMAVKPGMQVSVRDLLQGMLVVSANNAAIVVAEGIAGSVPQFAALMNQRAREIGLTRSRFTNPHGLPDAGQHITMREMAILTAHLIRRYPEHYGFFGQQAFTFNGLTQRNRNPLLGLGIGADGLKTGQTNEAGYALAASADQGGRRLILAMNGLRSEADRASEARKLLEWAFGSAPE